MFVQDLYIYPIKSLGGIRREDAFALERGFDQDRRLMLIDEHGKFITQRVFHQLSLLETGLSGSKVVVRHKKYSEKQLTISLKPESGAMIDVTVWDDRTKAIHLSDDADNWFSEFLQKPCKLVYMPEDSHRQVDSRYSEKGENVSFADAFPYLLIGQASLDDLNSRLSDPVPMNRFRPNIVVQGSPAFEEDRWELIQIADVRFKIAKPCARCILTTVDQETGIKGQEPLLTLSQYRSFNHKVLFGQNLIALNNGIIKANDPVTVLSYKG